MKMCRGSSHHPAAIGVVFVITLIIIAPVLCQDQKRVCPDELNPFNIRPYNVPAEVKGEPNIEELALYWIPREDLGCQLNHNDELKKKVNFTRSVFADISSKLFVSDRCQDFVKYWLDRTIKVVQHNLLITVKVKAIRFFERDQTFKRFEFKALRISSLPPDQILQVLDKTGQDLRNGLTLPGNANIPSFASYNETFSEVLRVYNGLYHALYDLREVMINRVSGCENTDTQCLGQLYKTLVGESNEWSVRVLGYAEIRKIVEEGIRVVRNYFIEGSSASRETFDGLKLPMVPPCFNT